jgi:phenylacetate-coenzyme A ligase PaaK-like adenylate-forming protein
MGLRTNQSLAYVFETSGSTGQPKIMRTGRIKKSVIWQLL